MLWLQMEKHSVGKGLREYSCFKMNGDIQYDDTMIYIVIFRWTILLEVFVDSYLFENNHEEHPDSAGSCWQKDKDWVQYVPCERAGGGPYQLSQRLYRGAGKKVSSVICPSMPTRTISPIVSWKAIKWHKAQFNWKLARKLLLFLFSCCLGFVVGFLSLCCLNSSFLPPCVKVLWGET